MKIEMHTEPQNIPHRYEVMGFSFRSQEELKEMRLWLRFSPAAVALLATLGVLLQTWWPLLVAVLSGIVMAATGYHPVDGLAVVVRRFLGIRKKLPPHPVPRRFSNGLASMFLAMGAIAFFYDSAMWGTVVAAMMGLVGVFVSSTNICIGAYIYRLFRPTSPPGC